MSVGSRWAHDPLSGRKPPLSRQPERRVRRAETSIAVLALYEFEEQPVIDGFTEQLEKSAVLVFIVENITGLHFCQKSRIGIETGQHIVIIVPGLRQYPEILFLQPFREGEDIRRRKSQMLNGRPPHRFYEFVGTYIRSVAAIQSDLKGSVPGTDDLAFNDAVGIDNIEQ
jgi:hypothetical protein